jgi:hypothetical protein
MRSGTLSAGLCMVQQPPPPVVVRRRLVGRSQRLGNLLGANYVTNANGTVTLSHDMFDVLADVRVWSPRPSVASSPPSTTLATLAVFGTSASTV